MVFENIVADYDAPCLIDVKLDKQKQMDLGNNKTTSMQFGFRICGMQVSPYQTIF